MRTDLDDTRATPWLALFIGALIAVVAAIGYLIYSGAASTGSMRLAANLPTASDAPHPQPPPAPPPKPAG